MRPPEVCLRPPEAVVRPLPLPCGQRHLSRWGEGGNDNANAVLVFLSPGTVRFSNLMPCLLLSKLRTSLAQVSCET